MTRVFGIDTSVLVRLLVGEPPGEYERCVARLTVLVEEQDFEIFASNQVIGEAYIAVQHHYGVSRNDARQSLLSLLQKSGLVRPLNGRAVTQALTSANSPGLFDRLIADDYERAGLKVLTLDRKMATLANAQRL